MTQTQTQTDTYDPWEAANAAQPIPDGPFTVFGQVQADSWPAVLEKGAGKVRFDPQIHAIDKRVTAIEISVWPTDVSRQPTKREMIVEGREWANVVKPSIAKLGTDLRAMNGRFVEAQLVPTGRKYNSGVDADGKPIQKESTTFRFVQIFPDETACIAAAAARWPGGAPVAGVSGG